MFPHMTVQYLSVERVIRHQPNSWNVCFFYLYLSAPPPTHSSLSGITPWNCQ